MSQAKHTSGPWFITGSLTQYIEARIGGGFIQEVASVGPTVSDGGYGPQQKANARLIAAAPELLDALRSMLAQFNFNTITGIVHDESAVIVKAREAVAKATGGE